MATNLEDGEIRTLVHKRGALKARVTRFTTYIDSIQRDQELTQLKLRLAKFEPTWQEFEDVQSRLEYLDPDSALQATEREGFENSYFSVMATAETHIGRMTPAMNTITGSGSSSVNERDNLTQVKLPTINLPTFNGAYDQWLTFVDTFQSLIHDNANISSIQKFHYLRSSLIDDAAQVIHSLEISALNYDVAWELLKERFQNKRIIVQNHVKALFDIPVMTKESHSALRQLLDAISRHLRALKSLDQPIESWDALMIHLITSKFDPTTKREWESISDAKELPKMVDMNKFLQNRCHLLQSLFNESPTNQVKQQVVNSSKSRNKSRNTNFKSYDQPQTYVASHKPLCPKCSQMHLIFQCEEFLALPISDRIKEIQRLNLCLNCLRSDHHVKQCNGRKCRTCARKHNTLLHLVSSGEMGMQDQAAAVVHHVAQPVGDNHILLSTAVITVYDCKGQPQQGRVLLDSGSQSNFITKEFAHRLKLDFQHINLPVTGINQAMTPVSQMTQARIQSRFNNFHATLPFLVLQKITDHLPVLQVDRANLKIPSNITMADPSFDTPAAVDMLLGAQIFWDLLCVGQIKLKGCTPILQKTQFGWVISGSINMSPKLQNPQSRCHLITNATLHNQLSKFWSIEETPPVQHFSKEEVECESHFELNTIRDIDGRFVVKLPLRDNAQTLGDSRFVALKRLQHVERRFNKNPTMKQQYSSELDDYLKSGHMERLKDSEIHTDLNSTCYLPHHAVAKEGSPITNIRVVFDASAATSSGVSLNDLLLVGPTIQEDLFSIVCRFRLHKYVLTADIVKMYRQVWVHPEQTDLQRILWRNDPQSPVETYRLKTVTFGTASAPFLATRCLHRLASDESEAFPVASEVIKRDFYIDDLLTGTESKTKLKELKESVTKVLSSGGFQLHKWNSNCSELRDVTTERVQKQDFSQLMKSETVKTLGLYWDSSHDDLRYQVKPPRSSARLTKRHILSIIAEIYDPLGLLGPIIITAKIIIQKLWQLKSDWDETVPMDIFTQWQRYEQSLEEINSIRVPRRVIAEGCIRDVQLHGFCDASEAAYGACIYIRVGFKDGTIATNLLCAKSRVAPLKTISIPRLELSSALLLAQLANKTTKALTWEIPNRHYWTDSTIVLAWINSSPHVWKSFVANRTAELQELTASGKWHHVSTHDNPADVLSRGATVAQLDQDDVWWHGPAWLNQNKDQWTNASFISDPPENVPEARVAVKTCTLSVKTNNYWFDRYSSLRTLVNVVAFCLRFMANCRSPDSKQTNSLQVFERELALTRLLQIAQGEVFKQDIRYLKQTNQVHPKSKLLSLSPFIDQDGLLRVGGRLQKADISQDQKHQIILPTGHKLTSLIITNEHLKQLHAGTQATLTAVRLKFWPVAGRRTTKAILHRCLRCFRIKPTHVQPIMGQLPIQRITPSRPFSVCGVDYCGPFFIREGGRYSKKKVKAYGAVFVCFATRAVHLELVSSLTTEAFINALKRFIGRRGKCNQIFSDNATNFVGAQKELQMLKQLFNSEHHQTSTASWLAEEGVKWSFIPANSPHFGGIWEAAVKAAKHHLRRVVGDASLTFEELQTVLIQIESCLNSRPITPMSSDPNDLAVLTPGHFLIGESLSAHGEPSLAALKINRLSRWQRVQQLSQHFWSRWSKEYLSQLQGKNKWQTPSIPIKEGTLVLMREDRTPPLQWPIGRVHAVHPGVDGIIRVATVKTSTGTFKRAVARLCVLPIDL